MTPARDMTVPQLIAEKAHIEKLWDDRRADDEFEGGSGSPGEWMIERLMEIETALKRAASVDRSPKGGDPEGGSVEDESAVGAAETPKG